MLNLDSECGKRIGEPSLRNVIMSHCLTGYGRFEGMLCRYFQGIGGPSNRTAVDSLQFP